MAPANLIAGLSQELLALFVAPRRAQRLHIINADLCADAEIDLR
jgi:hypothetical protein